MYIEFFLLLRKQLQTFPPPEGAGGGKDYESNSNFMSSELQSSFSLRCKSKTGKNILTIKFR